MLPDEWQYLNITSWTSTWERRTEPGGFVMVEYTGAAIVQVWTHGSGADPIAWELVRTFGLTATPLSAQDVPRDRENAP
jgi:hypothetical protein